MASSQRGHRAPLGFPAADKGAQALRLSEYEKVLTPIVVVLAPCYNANIFLIGGIFVVSFLLAIIYLSFISLGLPDGLLGAAWPSMQPDMGVSVGAAGAVSMTIAGCTIISSLASDRLIRRFGTGLVTAVSVAMTAAALIGFSMTREYWMLFLWALPYGLGAGSVDAALNNFVALHYEARHMSWLHCMWGLGATAGPYVMGFCLTNGMGWPAGYRAIGIVQFLLTAVLFFSLPMWKKKVTAQWDGEKVEGRTRSIREILTMPGAKQVLIAFFCYSAVETTTGLWGSSYMVGYRGISPEKAAAWISLFYLGITLGRGGCGFIAGRLSDRALIRLGEGVILTGLVMVILPAPELVLCTGLLLVGIGCAPIYPSIIHSTPDNFGRDASQSIMGVQMASAYVGSTFMPPIVGAVVGKFGMWLYPVILLGIAVAMLLMTEWLRRIKSREGCTVSAQMN